MLNSSRVGGKTVIEDGRGDLRGKEDRRRGGSQLEDAALSECAELRKAVVGRKTEHVTQKAVEVTHLAVRNEVYGLALAID